MNLEYLNLKYMNLKKFNLEIFEFGIFEILPAIGEISKVNAVILAFGKSGSGGNIFGKDNNAFKIGVES